MIDANYIRQYASDTYVKNARQRGDSELVISVRHVEAGLKKAGLQSGRVPLICSVLRGSKFQRENSLSLDHWDGPPSGQSTTVVFHFRLKVATAGSPQKTESPEQHARRLTEKLCGIMKEEIGSRGGTRGYLRWVRSEHGEVA
jgi:hypothetical protein